MGASGGQKHGEDGGDGCDGGGGGGGEGADDDGGSSWFEDDIDRVAGLFAQESPLPLPAPGAFANTAGGPTLAVGAAQAVAAGVAGAGSMVASDPRSCCSVGVVEDSQPSMSVLESAAAPPDTGSASASGATGGRGVKRGRSRSDSTNLSGAAAAAFAGVDTRNVVARRVGADEEGLIVVGSTAEFVRLEKVGSGTYGVVYAGRNRDTGAAVALKRIRLDKDLEGVPPTTVREISALKELVHENVVRLLDVAVAPTALHMIFEFVELDLQRLLDFTRPGRLEPALVRSYSQQMLRAVAYCHSRGYLHRDLKPQNVLIDRNGALKLADFGLVRACNQPSRTFTHEVVTLWYRAPEILLGAPQYHKPVDVFSVGAIIAEMLIGSPLFPGDSEIGQLMKIFRLLGTPTEDVWPGVSSLPFYSPELPAFASGGLVKLLAAAGVSEVAIDLLQKMVALNPSARITAAIALSHPYFADG